MTKQPLTRTEILLLDVSAVLCVLPSLNRRMLLVYRWKFEFMKDIFVPVAEAILTPQTPQYQAILELDRKVREKPLPIHFRNFLGSEECSPSVYIQKCMLWHYRATSMPLSPTLT